MINLIAVDARLVIQYVRIMLLNLLRIKKDSFILYLIKTYVLIVVYVKKFVLSFIIKQNRKQKILLYILS